MGKQEKFIVTKAFIESAFQAGCNYTADTFDHQTTASTQEAFDDFFKLSELAKEVERMIEEVKSKK